MFSSVKNGYNPQEVDNYINTLEQVVNSYKEKDAAIKNAIISAQIAADNIMKNAQYQAVEYRNIITQQMNRIVDSVNLQRLKIRAFQEDYNAIIHKYLTTFNENDIERILHQITELEQYLKGLEVIESTSSETELTML